MLAIFVATIIGLTARPIPMGAVAMLAALVLAFFSTLFSSMAHYGTDPAPVLYGSGYVDMASW